MTQLNQKQEKNPDTSGLIRKSDYNKRLQKKKVKYLVLVSGLASTSAFTVVENKIPNVRSLVKKKTDYNTKISKIEKKLIDHDHDKYINTPEFNNLTAGVFTAK